MHPLIRQEGLIVVTLDDELLVYDLERHRAHCLNRSAALVWRHCDGETSVEQLAGLLSRELKAEVGNEYVWYALRRLRNSRLLATSSEIAAEDARWTRRDLLRGLAAVGAAAVVLPTVVSMVAPATLYAQASCLPAGSVCTPGGLPCCAGLRCRGLPPGSPGTCRP